MSFLILLITVNSLRGKLRDGKARRFVRGIASLDIYGDSGHESLCYESGYNCPAFCDIINSNYFKL